MQELNGIPLNSLRAAAAVAARGSLAAAAEALGVSPGAVSQQVARAETALGLRLFDRRPEGLRPTERGAEICRLLEEGLGRIGSAVALAKRERSAVLTISVAPIFAARWMIWRLPRFHAAHPEISIRLDNTLGLVDPNTADVDLCLRIGRGNYPGVEVSHLLTQYVVPVCAPALAERVREPADLMRVPIIREPKPQFGWEAWAGPEGLDAAALPDGPVYPDAALCFDAAMAGGGVFLAFETLCRDALDRGSIVAPIPRMHPNGLSYWLVWARDRSLGEPARLFRRWLRTELAASGMGLGEV